MYSEASGYEPETQNREMYIDYRSFLSSLSVLLIVGVMQASFVLEWPILSAFNLFKNFGFAVLKLLNWRNSKFGGWKVTWLK